MRHGRRAARGSVVVHLLTTAPASSSTPKVGFVVSRSVGESVTRNQVRRRLRHLMRERLHQLPAGAMLVLRATPTAARHGSAELATDLDQALATVMR